MKKKVFGNLDQYATDDAILASSTSCIMPSKFTADLKHKSQCIVAHPVSDTREWVNPGLMKVVLYLLLTSCESLCH